MSHDGIPLMAVIHNPVTKQTWAAKQGCGTHYTFDEFASIVRVDNPVSGPWLTAICAWPGVDATYADFDRAVNNDRRFSDQKMGAFGLGGGLIASGLLHATTISSKSAVETAAMSLIVREAGGLVCDLYGGPLTKFKLGKNNGKVDFLLPRGAILACNHQVLSALVKLYKQH
jgi:fructose-1,6-bisphosphatase/inositol monophosphatase family enzyme